MPPPPRGPPRSAVRRPVPIWPLAPTLRSSMLTIAARGTSGNQCRRLVSARCAGRRRLTDWDVCEPITGEVVAEVTLDPVSATMCFCRRRRRGRSRWRSTRYAASPLRRSASPFRIDVDVGARRQVGAVDPDHIGAGGQKRRAPSSPRSVRPAPTSACAPRRRVTGSPAVPGPGDAGRRGAGGSQHAAHRVGADVGGVDGEQHGVLGGPGSIAAMPARSEAPIPSAQCSPPPDAPAEVRRRSPRRARRRRRRTRRRRARKQRSASHCPSPASTFGMP